MGDNASVGAVSQAMGGGPSIEDADSRTWAFDVDERKTGVSLVGGFQYGEENTALCQKEHTSCDVRMMERPLISTHRTVPNAFWSVD